MKVFLSNSSSIIEFLYLVSLFRAKKVTGMLAEFPTEPTLVGSVVDADVVIGTTEFGVSGKIVIVNLANYYEADLKSLAESNRILARFPLPRSIKYELTPYDLRVGLDPKYVDIEIHPDPKVDLNNATINSWDLTYSKDTRKYKLLLPRNYYLFTEVAKHQTLIGLLKLIKDDVTPNPNR